MPVSPFWVPLLFTRKFANISTFDLSIYEILNNQGLKWISEYRSKQYDTPPQRILILNLQKLNLKCYNIMRLLEEAKFWVSIWYFSKALDRV